MITLSSLEWDLILHIILHWCNPAIWEELWKLVQNYFCFHQIHLPSSLRQSKMARLTLKTGEELQALEQCTGLTSLLLTLNAILPAFQRLHVRIIRRLHNFRRTFSITIASNVTGPERDTIKLSRYCTQKRFITVTHQEWWMWLPVFCRIDFVPGLEPVYLVWNPWTTRSIADEVDSFAQVHIFFTRYRYYCG